MLQDKPALRIYLRTQFIRFAFIKLVSNSIRIGLLTKPIGSVCSPVSRFMDYTAQAAIYRSIVDWTEPQQRYGCVPKLDLGVQPVVEAVPKIEVRPSR